MNDKYSMKKLCFEILFFVIFFTLNVFSQNNNITIIPYGATNEVSGSLTEIEYKWTKLLIDCGAYYPEGDPSISLAKREKIASEKNQKLPFRAKDIDCLLLTHAHLDHCGRIPLLVKSGFNGTIYVSPGTKKLLKIMLVMQIRYDNLPRKWTFSTKSIKNYDNDVKTVKGHWNNCKWQQKIAYSNKISIAGKRKDIENENNYSFNKISPCKICSQIEYNSIKNLVKEIPYNKEIIFNKNISFKYMRTEHIPGASAIMLTIKGNEKNEKNIIFSGDIGNDLEILYPKPKPFPKSDIIFIESTYGNTIRDNIVYKEEQKFKNDLIKALNNNQLVWIPSFALDRTQKMLLMVKEALKSNPQLKSTPVYCPSPSANEITKLYKEELETKEHVWFKSNVYLKYQHSNLFLNYSRKFPKKIKGPSIIITTSGMMESAFSENLLTELSKTRTTVFIVGYQDPGTPGGFLKSGKKELSWHDKKYLVNSTINSYKCFSSHTDFMGSLNILKKQDKKSINLYLNHGEKSAISNKKKSFIQRGFKNVNIAQKNKKIVIRFNK